MKIFLSYASEDRTAAEAIHVALCSEGHDVFFDREDLPPGEEFNVRIRRAVECSDVLIFLVSPQALDAHSYTLNELAIAEQTYKRASGRVLPVMLRQVDFDNVPVFLKSVTFLQTSGDLPAAVADAVARMARKHGRARMLKVAMAIVLIAGTGIGGYAWMHREPSPEITGGDGAPAVLIPAGTFIMGDDENSPKRQIFVDAFYMDRYEVTVARYAKFLEATGSTNPPDKWDTVDLRRNGELPVIGVDWRDAEAYCTWSKKRLPTEAEWEKAARGVDERLYPWGHSTPQFDEANFRNMSPEAYAGGLTAVGTHHAGSSAFGVEDLAGNAAEWVADWYTETFPTNDVRNPKGPGSGEGKVIRGGGRFDPPERVTATIRFHASVDTRHEDVGFRCATG